MATYTKVKLSGSTYGKNIAVAATSGGGSGTAIHTAVTGTTSLDEVWIYATNIDTSAHKLTIEFGATTAADLIELTIQPESGPVLVIPGWLLQNSLPITAFAASANKININGFINRIS